jgi:hypothetical protein
MKPFVRSAFLFIPHLLGIQEGGTVAKRGIPMEKLITLFA